MNGQPAAKKKFKSKGASILKPIKSGSESMKEFLLDQPAKTTTDKSGAGINTQNHKSAIAQTHSFAKAKTHKTPTDDETETSEPDRSPAEKIERLHVHIRKDLADRLLEMVFKRKCDHKVKKNQATQRVIIEEALDEYFSNHNK